MPHASLSSIGLTSPSAQKTVVKKLDAKLTKSRTSVYLTKRKVFDELGNLIRLVCSYSAGRVLRSFKI